MLEQFYGYTIFGMGVGFMIGLFVGAGIALHISKKALSDYSEWRDDLEEPHA